MEFTEPLVSVREGRSVTVCVSVTEGTIESEPPAGIELNTVFVTGAWIASLSTAPLSMCIYIVYSGLPLSPLSMYNELVHIYIYI